MSYTEIFSISASHCHSLGETKNAWRGAIPNQLEDAGLRA